MDPGSRLGPYEIQDLVGKGGMGEVYRAIDIRLNRTVALKILQRVTEDNQERRDRFAREAHAISSLNHPHICTLYDVGREGDVEYLVMEYLEGGTLAERLERGPLPIATAVEYGRQIAEALAVAHRQGIIHRDLKPGNVIVTKTGVKLLDFGLAKIRSASSLAAQTTVLLNDAASLTRQGALLGTLQYMAPISSKEGKPTPEPTSSHSDS